MSEQTRPERTLEALDRELNATLDDVLPRRLGSVCSQDDWESLAKEVRLQLAARFRESPLLGQILAEGDIRTPKGKINMAGFLEALEKEINDDLPPQERTQMTHLVSYLKHAAQRIPALKRR